MGVAERREREREERRNQIIDAAEHVFFDVGAAAATMDHVARAAELSKGTLYLYFKSRDELYLAIATRGVKQLVERLETVEGSRLNGYQLLEQVSRVMREFGADNPEHMKTVLAWMASGFHASPESDGYEEYLALVSRLIRQVVSVVELGQRDGSIRGDVHAREFVMQLWGGQLGVWMLFFRQGQVGKRMPMPVRFDELVSGHAEMLLRAVRAPGQSNGAGS